MARKIPERFRNKSRTGSFPESTGTTRLLPKTSSTECAIACADWNSKFSPDVISHRGTESCSESNEHSDKLAEQCDEGA